MPGTFYLLIPDLKLSLWSGCDSNARPPVYQTGATKPTELPDHICGHMWDSNPSETVQMSRACQLHYTAHMASILIGRLQRPTTPGSPGGIRTLKISLLRRTRIPVPSPGHLWASRDSNPEHHVSETCASSSCARDPLLYPR